MKKKQERKDDKIGQQFFAPKHRKNERNYFLKSVMGCRRG